MSHQEIIAVVQAHKEGKQIQTQSHLYQIGWQNCNPVWNFYENDYRVAPEPRKPREFIVNLYNDGSISSTFERRELQIDQILVREVIE